MVEWRLQPFEVVVELRSNHKIMFKDKLSILPANLDKSEDLINQISETINASAEAKKSKFSSSSLQICKTRTRR